MLKVKNFTALIVGTISLAALVTGCGDGKDKPAETGPKVSTTDEGTKPSGENTLSIDGSTTVYPIVSAMAEDFGKANPGTKPVVNKAGTGSGFQKFSRGEIDIATASRPIEAKEEATLKEKGIEYIEIPIAYDGVSVIVNPENKWFDAATTEELKKAWSEGSAVKTWADIRSGLPSDKITFYGPTDNHGTYEYFTEAINGKKNSIRKEYQPNQEYTAIVSAVAGDKNGIAFVGYNYFAENKDKIKAVTVNGVSPSETTIADGTYKPLSRPLFIYVNKERMTKKTSVKLFVDYAMSKVGDSAISEAKYVVLPAETKAAIQDHVTKMVTGTKFKDFKPGNKLEDLYKSK